jgi:hypothetical protein
MTTTPGRLHIGLYLLGISALSALTIALSYAVFAAGFADGVESFLADPSGTVQGNLLGVLAIAGIFVSLFLLFAAIVVGGARYADLEQSGNRQSK